MGTSASWIESAFVRGGTSKGLFFTDAELPLSLPGSLRSDAAGSPERRRDAVLCAALGSPDPFGRQLDGMGGGVSSLSKAVIVGRSTRAGIDLEYTFAQVPVGGDRVDYSGNCGNLSSGVVPFALISGLVTRGDGVQEFALFNTNTGKVVNARLLVEGGQAAVRGSLSIPGVAGQGSPIELAYPDPGGSRTCGVLPTGMPAEELSVSGHSVRVSIVDVAIPLVLVPALEIGLTGAERPADLEAREDIMALLDELRRAGAVRAGLCADPASAPLAVPKVVVVAPTTDAMLLSGQTQPAGAADLLARTVSMERVHGAVPGTGAMCVAAAAMIPGTVVAELLKDFPRTPEVPLKLRIGTPSGVVTASATGAAGAVSGPDNRSVACITETALSRTARVLMHGRVAVELG